MARFNPFRPGGIVSPGMFSGRYNELLTLEKILHQTRNGNPAHFAITGERGIGKSSLLFYLTLVASGQITSIEDETFRFIVLNTELQPTSSYIDIMKKVGAELQRTINSHETAKAQAKSVWEFISRWEAFGIAYRSPEKKETPPELLEDLSHTIAQVVSRLRPNFDGILLLIDEADKAPATSGLGQFVKLLTERLTKRGCENVSIGLAGLPTISQKLRESHESSLRIFNFMNLLPLEPMERITVIEKGLATAQEKNGYEIKATPAAQKAIADMSEGYPHFIQQFAYCAFEADTDDEIDESDVQTGAFKEEDGAIRQLGTRYFENLYFDQIQSDEYREVLRAMSTHMDEFVDRSTIHKETGIRLTTLDNALTALKKRDIILPQRGKKGAYRLPTRSFAAWIRAFTNASPEETSSAKQIALPAPAEVGDAGSTTQSTGIKSRKGH